MGTGELGNRHVELGTMGPASSLSAQYCTLYYQQY